MQKKWIAILLTLGMLLSVLTACGTAAPEEPLAPETTAEPETTESPEEGESFYDTLERGYTAYAPDTVVLTIEGEEVTWELFYYLLSECLLDDYIPYMYAMPDFRAEVMEGATFSDAFIDGALSKCEYFTLGRHYFREGGYELSEEEQASLDTLWTDLLSQVENEEELMEMLRESYLSKDTYMFLAESNMEMNSLMEHIYGRDGGRLTEEKVLSWAEENNYSHAKHILYYIYDDTGTLLPEEDKAVKRAEAEAALAELQKLTGDQEALLKAFDEKMHAESEDPGLTSYPDGYTFPEGTMHPPFEAAIQELEDYELSEIVETSSGYHIILRLPLEADLPGTGVSAQGGDNSLRATAARSLFAADIAQWINDAEIVWMPGFENLDLAEVYGQ